MNPHEPLHNPNPPEESMEEFADLERELRQVLRPIEPPTGFANRVIARARAGAAPQPKRARILILPKLRSRVWIPSAVAAMLFVGIAGQQAHEKLEKHRKAEEAQKQFETALQVTDRALEHTRMQLQRAGISFGEE